MLTTAACGTFESDTDGTYQSDTPGTFQTVTDGTFHSAMTGTFQSDTGGTSIPLLSWPESVTATTPIKGGPIIKLLEKFVTKVYSKSDLILVQSKSFKDSICAKGDFENKLVFAPNWAEDSFINADISIDEKFPLQPSNDEFRVMFAGNIGEAQDFRNIIKAAELTRDISDIKWIIVGDGRAREESEKEVERLGLSDTVRFLGRHPVTTMPKFFAQADVMLVTLKDEFIFSLTIPSKTQAYMASGKPILTMLNGAGSDVVNECKR